MMQQSPQLLAWLKDPDVSQGIRLYFFIVTQPPGVPITMQQMQDAIGVSHSKAVSQLLTRIRHGRISTGTKGQFFDRIAISYDRHTKSYYDIGKTTEDSLEQQVPQSILDNLARHVKSRTESIESAIGEAGLGKAISEGLLSGTDALELLKTVPTLQLHALRDNVDKAIASRERLETYKELQPGQKDAKAIEGP